MLLPSGRSNSDAHPMQTSNVAAAAVATATTVASSSTIAAAGATSAFLVSVAPSPQLSLKSNASSTISRNTENGFIGSGGNNISNISNFTTANTIANNTNGGLIYSANNTNSTSNGTIMSARTTTITTTTTAQATAAAATAATAVQQQQQPQQLSQLQQQLQQQFQHHQLTTNSSLYSNGGSGSGSGSSRPILLSGKMNEIGNVGGGSAVSAIGGVDRISSAYQAALLLANNVNTHASTTSATTNSTTTATTTTTGTPAAIATTTTIHNTALTAANAMAAVSSVLSSSGNWQEIDRHLEVIQHRLKEGWTVHLGKEGRLYYCNHLTQTAGWLPSCEDWSKQEELPYGWERGIDAKGRSYYINHLNKTSTYEAPETVRWEETQPPEPRVCVLQRSPTLGFGFVAGSERPVIVRFVTDGGPSMNKLQPGDQILAVNGEDVKDAQRDHVIQLVRACETAVTLLVCQPVHNLAPGRKSTLLSAGKRAKLRARPIRVRFAESVCVNGAPLFPPSAFSLGDICVPPMANVLKVFLENGQTKSFKYDATTTVRDVVSSLLDKLCLCTGDIFSLMLEHVKSLKRNKLTLLDPEESLARIAARPGAHKLRCLFRVTFVPISAEELAKRDLNSLDYFYMQCCNDVTQERFAPELQPEVALRLAALHIHQHALANNISPAKLTVKVVEREFGLERFVPASLFDGMKRKDLRRIISHFLKRNAEMTGSSNKSLTQLQAKLHYLDIIAGLPSYGAKCFSTNQREGVERVLLVSPRFGLSQISSIRNSMPQPISAIEDFTHVIVHREDDISCSVNIFIHGDRAVKFNMEDRDACEFSLVLAGYYKLLTGRELPVEREREAYDEDNAPSYLAQHTVLPAAWSYLLPFANRAHSMNFLMAPPYHTMKIERTSVERDEQQCDRNMNSANVLDSNAQHAQKKAQLTAATVATATASPSATAIAQTPFVSTAAMDLDIHSVMATELLEEAKDSGLSDSSGGGSSAYCERPPFAAVKNDANRALIEARNEEVLRRVQEMQKMVENSEQYLTEQGELSVDYEPQSRSGVNSGGGVAASTPGGGSMTGGGIIGAVEFDSDCDSLNSSKISSTEETPQPGALKHSDSLVLLAEAINQDLTGITKSLNSIGGGNGSGGGGSSGGSGTSSQPDLKLSATCSLSATSSPRPERKLNGFGQLLSNLQALGNDFSQSESDSESINSPTNSPTMRRPPLLCGDGVTTRKQSQTNAAYRSSFGLHSPDGSNFGPEAKDYNLREYLKQLKEISNVQSGGHDMDLAAKKLSEIYGFEVREDTFIETDAELIDLRAIPPPQTPDELDALSLLNAAPHGFADAATRRPHTGTAGDDEVDSVGELDKFLAKVVVAPPTQKATPAKELTPEEIMSFIIPPPPNLDDTATGAGAAAVTTANTPIATRSVHNAVSLKKSASVEQPESLYSNSVSEKRELFNRLQRDSEASCLPPARHVIEYSTVERRSKFSCCPKSRKDSNSPERYGCGAPLTELQTRSDLQLPPRTQTHEKSPPARPPKSAELMQRFSPKKQLLSASNVTQVTSERTTVSASATTAAGVRGERPAPPQLPPRLSPTSQKSQGRSIGGAGEERSISPITTNNASNNLLVNSNSSGNTMVSFNAPKKPPLPPVGSRPVMRVPLPMPPPLNSNINGGTPPPLQPRPSGHHSIRHVHANTNTTNNMNTSTNTTTATTNSHCNNIIQRQPNSPAQSPNSPNGQQQQHQHQHQQQPQQPPQHYRECPTACLPSPLPEKRAQLSLLCSPQMVRKITTQNNTPSPGMPPTNSPLPSSKYIIKNGHVIDGEALLAKTDIAMAGLLVKLDQVAAQCSAAQAAGGGANINEEKFQRARHELTEQTLVLVTASKFLVMAMSDATLSTLPEHLTSCLTAIRRITELTQDMTRHTSAPLQTRNIVLKVHDVASSFRELVGVQIGPLGAGQLALQAECLANMLATLLRSLRVFSP